MRFTPGMVAQVAGVIVLGAVVYFAFLHPDDSGPLSGIDVETLEPPSPEVTVKRGKTPPAKPKDSPTARVVATTPAVGPAPVSRPGTPTADTPAGSQYESTVARILSRLADRP